MLLHNRVFRYDPAILSPEQHRGVFAMKFGKVLFSYHLTNAPAFIDSLISYTDPVTVRWVEIMSEDTVQAHTDFLITCSLNIYVTASNCVTRFWRPIDRSERPTDRFFPFSDLESLSQFEAQSGEAHLLNVGTLHSVHSTGTSPGVDHRSMVRLGWNIPPEEVLNKINNWVVGYGNNYQIVQG